MKKIITLYFLVNLFVSVISIYPQGYNYLSQALAKAVLVSGVHAGYEYRDGLCLLGVYLNSGSSYGINIYFNNTDNYRILGVADEDVYDLDISVEDLNGNTILKDNLRDNLPIVDYNPLYSGSKTVRIKNFSSRAPSFCIMILLKKRKFLTDDLPSFVTLTEALDNSVNLSRAYSTYLNSTTFVPGIPCLMGGYYSSGQEDGIVDFTIPSGTGGSFVFLGSSSNNCSDVDIKIINQNRTGSTQGETICEDNSSYKFALVNCNLWSWNKYYMSYKNYSSIGNAFVLGVIMKENSSNFSGNYNSPNNNSKKNHTTDSKNILNVISPVLGFSTLYFGKTLLEGGESASVKEINFCMNIIEQLKLSWSLNWRNKNSVGFIGILLETVIFKIAYNSTENTYYIPFWLAGFHWNDDSPILELTFGQMNVLNIQEITYVTPSITYLNYPVVESKKTFFTDLKCEFEITYPFWMNFSIRYPFFNGKELYQLGVGISLRL